VQYGGLGRNSNFEFIGRTVKCDRCWEYVCVLAVIGCWCACVVQCVLCVPCVCVWIVLCRVGLHGVVWSLCVCICLYHSAVLEAVFESEDATWGCAPAGGPHHGAAWGNSDNANCEGDGNHAWDESEHAGPALGGADHADSAWAFPEPTAEAWGDEAWGDEAWGDSEPAGCLSPILAGDGLVHNVTWS
jgi:hypothetical protein